MALQISFQFPVLTPTTPSPRTSPYPQIKPKTTSISTQPIINKHSTTIKGKKSTQFTSKAFITNNDKSEEEEGEEENPQSKNIPEPQIVGPPDEPEEPQPTKNELSELGSEIKKAMKEREGRERGGGDFWSGVAEEIREIEWPAFGKVLGTTGVVLGVIAGSSVVLLTVNAVLAELSDRVFAGKGVQDFFG